MINFSDPKDQVPSLLAVVGILGLVSSLVMLLFVPKPSVKGLEYKRIQAQRRLMNEISDSKKEIEALETNLSAVKFQEKPDLITAAVLTTLESKVKEAKITLVSFRPQRSVENTHLLQLPFVVNVDGAFPNVVKFLRLIENGNDKLAVNVFQLASAEGSGDLVSATIGVVAFRDPIKIEKEAPKPPAMTKPGQKPTVGTQAGKPVMTTKPALNIKAVNKPAEEKPKSEDTNGR